LLKISDNSGDNKSVKTSIFDFSGINQNKEGFKMPDTFEERVYTEAELNWTIALFLSNEKQNELVYLHKLLYT